MANSRRKVPGARPYNPRRLPYQVIDLIWIMANRKGKKQKAIREAVIKKFGRPVGFTVIRRWKSVESYKDLPKDNIIPGSNPVTEFKSAHDWGLSDKNIDQGAVHATPSLAPDVSPVPANPAPPDHLSPEKSAHVSWYNTPKALRISKAKLAKSLGVATTTLTAWEKHPDFKSFCEGSVGKDLKKTTESLIKSIVSKYEGRVYDTIAVQAIGGSPKFAQMFLQYFLGWSPSNTNRLEAVAVSEEIKSLVDAIETSIGASVEQ